MGKEVLYWLAIMFSTETLFSNNISRRNKFSVTSYQVQSVTSTVNSSNWQAILLYERLILKVEWMEYFLTK